MEEESRIEAYEDRIQPVGRFRFVWLMVLYIVESVVVFLTDCVREIFQAKELFLGAAFTVLGLMDFKHDKFCDGNTADYLSCTRPTAYMYYDGLAITLAIIGVFFILIWFLRQRRESISLEL